MQGLGSKRPLLVCFLLLIAASLTAQQLYWESSVPLVSSDANFPQVKSGSDFIVDVWEYFDENTKSVTLYAKTSFDGVNWSDSRAIIGPIDYYWRDLSSIFSLIVTPDDICYIAIVSAEDELTIYKSEDRGLSFEVAEVINTPTASVAPRMFVRSDGGIMLFVVQHLEKDFTETYGLTFSLIESDDGIEWNEPQLFVQEEDLRHNFLPFYKFHNGIEYVVFQSLYSEGNRVTYQLFMKKRESLNGSWSNAELITTLSEVSGESPADYFFWDNQRPYLEVIDNQLNMIWERHYIRQPAQIYRAILENGNIDSSSIQQITNDNDQNGFPQIFNFKGQNYFLWFKVGRTNKVILANEEQIASGRVMENGGIGLATFGRFTKFQDRLFLFWEEDFGDIVQQIILKPDESVATPQIIPTNYTAGQRSSNSTTTFSWAFSIDSSGIEGYKYLWNRDPNSEIKDMDLRLFRIPQNVAVEANDDGLWYFHVAVKDSAGNWSKTAHYGYYRDQTPPQQVDFILPETDENGYLSSNTFVIKWKNSNEEDLVGYSIKHQYLGVNIDPFAIDDMVLPETPLEISTRDQYVGYTNLDNGYWMLLVSTIDSSGNKGLPAVITYRLNKYQAITYISNVIAERDELGQNSIRIAGRGFLAGGAIQKVILDADKQEPWDYEYYLAENEFRVDNDYFISGLLLDELEAGEYYVAVEHPYRGLAFARYKIKLDSTGTVRYGDFSQRVASQWQAVAERAIKLTLNNVVVIVCLILLFIIAILAAFRLYAITAESINLSKNAAALINGHVFTSDEKEERIKTMKRRGLSLRIKFVIAFLALVLAVVSMVALFLGTNSINTQQISLGDELAKKSEILLNSMVTGAEIPILTEDTISAFDLIQQTSAMEEAVATTITSKSLVAASDKFNYIWTSNSEDINLYQEFPSEISSENISDFLSGGSDNQAAINAFYEFYSESDNKYILNNNPNWSNQKLLAETLINLGILKNDIGSGTTAIYDPIEEDLERISQRVAELANERISQFVREREELRNERTRLTAILGTDDEIAAIGETLDLLNRQIKEELEKIEIDILLEEGRTFRSYPEFNPIEIMELGTQNRTFTFYKPIIFIGGDSEYYYRGAVRLEISVENLINQVNQSRNSILRITLFTFVAAILFALAVSIFLAQMMVRPIKKLVAGVQVIRDTEDKSKLAGHFVDVKTKDELSELAVTINQMTDGLVKAAAANKDLVMGKEIQKKFIPLEEDTPERKKTTAKIEQKLASLFGYYEGAKGVSGDYFDYKQIDEDHFAVIKCDIAGKGLPAALIMVQVATIFKSYFNKLNIKKDGINVDQFVFQVNDQLEEAKFQGRFAAFIAIVINFKTGECWLSNAGDNQVTFYDHLKKEVFVNEIHECPAAGVFPSIMLEGPNGYIQEKMRLRSGDILFLYTDGIEEAKRLFRDKEFNTITCDNSCVPEDDENYELKRTHLEGSDNEEFGIPRLKEVTKAVLDKSTYEILKNHDPFPEKRLQFDYTSLSGTEEDTVLALIAAEKVFRLNPDPSATEEDRIMIDKKIDDFLKEHFLQYRDFFKYPKENTENGQYIYYTHLKEDAQYDDLTILAIRKK